MFEQLHQKVELRKASGLDSWKAVPTPTFQLYLGPCHFTSGFCLKGVLERGTPALHLNEAADGSCCDAGLGLVWRCYWIYMSFVCLIQKKIFVLDF